MCRTHWYDNILGESRQIPQQPARSEVSAETWGVTNEVNIDCGSMQSCQLHFAISYGTLTYLQCGEMDHTVNVGMVLENLVKRPIIGDIELVKLRPLARY